jgi:hypothetical protein
MKCPGQDMQYWESDAIFEVSCPECAQQVEFYKDDTTRKCGHCGHRFVNPQMDFGCAAYCKYAEQCLGTLPEEFIGSQDNLLKDKVAVEIKRFYKTDFKQISRVSRIAHHAERIGKEEGGNMGIILCASYLNDIGASQAEHKYNSQEPGVIKQESLKIATDILTRLGAKTQVLEEVCRLIQIHNTDDGQNVYESMILRDAQRTALLEEEHKISPLDPDTIEDHLETNYLTSSGKENARKTFEHLGVLVA